MIKKSIFILLLFLSFVSLSYAENSARIVASYNMQKYNQEIMHLFQTRLRNSTVDRNTKISQASGYFLGRSYYLGAMGEGVRGKFDQEPLYRTDVFDCMTYVEIVLALTHADNLSQFQSAIKKIRYQNGQVSYVHRNHFVSADWNPNNERKGYIHDITADLHLPYKIKVEKIDKRAWYAHKKASDLSLLQPLSYSELYQRLQDFHNLSKEVNVFKSKIKYIPLSALFSQQGQQIIPHWQAVSKIPSGSILELVNVKNDNTIVKHMGFVIKTPQGLMFREASSLSRKIKDVSLTSYLGSYWQLNNFSNEVGISVLSSY